MNTTSTNHWPRFLNRVTQYANGHLIQAAPTIPGISSSVTVSSPPGGVVAAGVTGTLITIISTGLLNSIYQLDFTNSNASEKLWAVQKLVVFESRKSSYWTSQTADAVVSKLLLLLMRCFHCRSEIVNITVQTAQCSHC